MDFTTLSLAELLALDFSTLSAEDLTACEAEVRARFGGIKDTVGTGTPTVAQARDAAALADALPQVRAASQALADDADADEDAAAEFAALSLDADEDGDDDGDDDAEGDEDAEGDDAGDDAADDAGDDAGDEGDGVEAATKPAKKVAAAVKTRARLAGQRPAAAPAATDESPFTITASADTKFATGSAISLADVGQAAVDKLGRLPEPSGTGDREDLRFFPVATLALDYPDDLKIDQSMSTEAIDQVFAHAGDESRLEGNSLTASNGWCAPSEIMYDLPNNEVVDGVLSVPEVQVNRGGFKHTTGIDWATVYSGVGFLQTESQAISGTSKTCYEVPCPTFVDERLDAIGICIKVPILLETGYPEMVTNITARSMVAHQYKVNASVISRIVTAAGSARDFSTDLGTTVGDTLAGVDLVLEQLRQKYRIGQNASIEVVFPVWARSVFRNDLSNRNGRGTPAAVTDAEIAAHFTARHANVQYVYGWQELTTSAVAFPTTLNFIAYPAGTFVKGVSNVINISAVYDAASLAVNIYTGLFMEQGLLVAKMNYEAVQATVGVNFAGHMGALNVDAA